MVFDVEERMNAGEYGPGKPSYLDTFHTVLPCKGGKVLPENHLSRHVYRSKKLGSFFYIKERKI